MYIYNIYIIYVHVMYVYRMFAYVYVYHECYINCASCAQVSYLTAIDELAMNGRAHCLSLFDYM